MLYKGKTIIIHIKTQKKDLKGNPLRSFAFKEEFEELLKFLVLIILGSYTFLNKQS